MQVSKEQYDPEKHTHYIAIALPQPLADGVMVLPHREKQNIYGAVKNVIVSTDTDYRGEVVICSTAVPNHRQYHCGAILGTAILYDVQPWHNGDFLYKLKEPRRAVELPCDLPRGLNDLYFTKDTITFYPREITLDKKGYRIATKTKKK